LLSFEAKASPSDFILRVIVEEDRKLVRRLNAIYVDAARDVNRPGFPGGCLV